MTVPNLQTTITTVNTEWLRIARPIIKTMFAVEDAIAPVTRERLNDPKGYVSYVNMSPQSHAWSEAQHIVDKAGNALHDMLDGIRDNALCDAYVQVDYDASDGVFDAQEQFNDDLRNGVMTVDAAVRMVGDENNG